jgi:hypothetical protein
MSADPKVRLIRKRNAETNAAIATEARHPSRREPSEREIKTVVSRWVRDHRQRSEEFRRNFTALLKSGEVHLPMR